MKKIVQFVLSPVILASLFFLCLQLPVFNLGLSYRDEGFFSYNAVRINKGEIPYRDFFLTTTPGTYYLNAFLFRIFGNKLIIGRLLYLFLGLFIIFMADKIFRLKKGWNYWYLFSLSIALVWPGGFAFYNTEAVLSAIVAFFFLKKGLDQENYLNFVFSGLAAAACFFFKQTIGTFTGISFLIIIFLEKRTGFRNQLKKALIFTAAAASPVFCYLIYLFFNGALPSFFYYTVVFAKTVKAHRQPFLIQRLVSIPILLLFFKFLFNPKIKTKNKAVLIVFALFTFLMVYLIIFPPRMNALIDHFRDPLYYFYSLAFFFPLIILAFPSKNKPEDLKCYSIVSLSIFLALGSSGYEIGAIKTLAVFFIPLFILSNLFPKMLIALFILSYAYFIFTNPFSANTKIFGVYPKISLTENLDSPQTRYIKISPEEKKDLTEIISYVKSHTQEKDKIFCFPYCPMLFVLTERENISYYSMFYFETFLAKDQPFVIGEIKNERPSLILVQKKGFIENEADFEDSRLSNLKDFLFQNTHVSLENNNFIILSPK